MFWIWEKLRVVHTFHFVDFVFLVFIFERNVLGFFYVYLRNVLIEYDVMEWCVGLDWHSRERCHRLGALCSPVVKRN